jgi:hypothetical protein
MHRYPDPKWLVVAVVCAAGFAIGGIAYANTPAANGVIQACYATDGSGALNVIDPANKDGSVPTSCVKGQAGLALRGGGAGFDVQALAFIVMMNASKSADQDLHEIAAAVEATNTDKRTMRTAIDGLIRAATRLRTHKGTVGALEQAINRVDALLATAPCVVNPGRRCG